MRREYNLNKYINTLINEWGQFRVAILPIFASHLQDFRFNPCNIVGILCVCVSVPSDLSVGELAALIL